jgi:hypothetical protein
MPMKGIPRPISIREISTFHLNRFFNKGCELCEIDVEEIAKRKSTSLEDFLGLQYFINVFEEIPRLPLKRDVDFSIDLMCGFASVSKAPFRISTPKLKSCKCS